MAPAGSRAPTMRTPVAGDPVTALPWPAARLGGRGSGGGAPRGPKAALLKGVGLDMSRPWNPGPELGRPILDVRRKSLAARPLQLPGSVNLLNAVEGRTSDALGTPLSLLHCGNLRCVSLARRSEICYSRSAAGKMHVEKVNTREGSAASPASARKVGQRLSRAARARPDEPGWPSPAGGFGGGNPREPGRRERRVRPPRGFLPPGEKAFELWGE